MAALAAQADKEKQACSLAITPRCSLVITASGPRGAGREAGEAQGPNPNPNPNPDPDPIPIPDPDPSPSPAQEKLKAEQEAAMQKAMEDAKRAAEEQARSLVTTPSSSRRRSR